MERKKLGLTCIGNTLAEDVFDEKGRRLLAAGTVINEKNLSDLQSRGIAEVSLEIEIAEESDLCRPVLKNTRTSSPSGINQIFRKG